MALHPFKPLTAWMMILLQVKYKHVLISMDWSGFSGESGELSSPQAKAEKGLPEQRSVRGGRSAAL
jgi:hypothetical protein